MNEGQAAKAISLTVIHGQLMMNESSDWVESKLLAMNNAYMGSVRRSRRSQFPRKQDILWRGRHRRWPRQCRRDHEWIISECHQGDFWLAGWKLQ